MTTLEERLANPIKPVITVHNQKNMMILYGHNPMVITDYEVDRPTHKKLEDVVNEVIELDEDFIQQQLERIDTVKDQIKEHLWSKIVPISLGLKIAEDETLEELSLLIGDTPINLEQYNRVVRDLCYADMINLVVEQLGLDASVGTMILRAKLDSDIYIKGKDK